MRGSLHGKKDDPTARMILALESSQRDMFSAFRITMHYPVGLKLN